MRAKIAIPKELTRTGPIDIELEIRVKEPIEAPAGRVRIGWHDGRDIYCDIYPSDWRGMVTEEE